MASNLANKGVYIVTCQMMFAPYALPIWFEIFMKFMQELKFRVPARILFSMHASTKIQFSIMHVKHMMVWWYTCHALWPQNNIWTNLKVSYTIHKLWSTVVWPNLPKFITNSIFLKIFWSLHLQHLCVKYCPYEKKNVNKQSFSTNALSYIWSSRSHVSLNPTISYCFSTVNSPSIVQMTSNLAQGWTVTHVKWCFAQCHANLFFFQENHAKILI